MSWLSRILGRSDLTQNSWGTPGENIGAPIYPGQAAFFTPDKRRKRKRNVYQTDTNKIRSEDRYDVNKM